MKGCSRDKKLRGSICVNERIVARVAPDLPGELFHVVFLQLDESSLILNLNLNFLQLAIKMQQPVGDCKPELDRPSANPFETHKSRFWGIMAVVSIMMDRATRNPRQETESGKV